MSHRIHPQARTTPKVRQEIKESSKACVHEELSPGVSVAVDVPGVQGVEESTNRV